MDREGDHDSQLIVYERRLVLRNLLRSRRQMASLLSWQTARCIQMAMVHGLTGFTLYSSGHQSWFWCLKSMPKRHMTLYSSY